MFMGPQRNTSEYNAQENLSQPPVPQSKHILKVRPTHARQLTRQKRRTSAGATLHERCECSSAALTSGYNVPGGGPCSTRTPASKIKDITIRLQIIIVNQMQLKMSRLQIRIANRISTHFVSLIANNYGQILSRRETPYVKEDL